MTTVLLVIHVIIAIALVAVILLQRSEGGALGIGGGGGFMSARGQGNALTKATAILAVCFLGTSIGLTVLQSVNQQGNSIIDEIERQQTTPGAGIRNATPPTGESDTGTTGNGATDTGNGESKTPAVPLSD